uniref:Uncharacterized protein n=1 Tax=Timema bartmani TaxID=61472 RepID=A0A7R9EXK5_9NEOP|nr:unnamed protein product [Timema bartmani]
MAVIFKISALGLILTWDFINVLAGYVSYRVPGHAGGISHRMGGHAGGISHRMGGPTGGISHRMDGPMGGISHRMSGPSGGISHRMGGLGMGAPGMGAPGMGAPGMGAPGMGAPGMGAPGMGAPGMGAYPVGPPMMGGFPPNPVHDLGTQDAPPGVRHYAQLGLALDIMPRPQSQQEELVLIKYNISDSRRSHNLTYECVKVDLSITYRGIPTNGLASTPTNFSGVLRSEKRHLDLNSAFQALDMKRVNDANLVHAVNDVKSWFARDLQSKVHLTGFDVFKYNSRGEVLRALLEHLESFNGQPEIPQETKENIRSILPFIMTTGIGNDSAFSVDTAY